MRFTIVVLSAVLCLNAKAESSIDARSDDAIVAAAEQLIAEGEKSEPSVTVAANDTKPGTTSTETKELKESEIPVFAEPKKIQKAEGNLIWRLVASLGILTVVCGGLIFASKRWGKKSNVGGTTARIEIMHQLHMGPKRSIALIRVAGEAILIGITDQNVSMLKSITLIDDELQNTVTQNFNGFLEDEFSIEDVRSALNPRA